MNNKDLRKVSHVHRDWAKSTWASILGGIQLRPFMVFVQYFMRTILLGLTNSNCA